MVHSQNTPTKVAVLGAGRSAGRLIHFLLQKSTQYAWQIHVADADVQKVHQLLNHHPNGYVLSVDLNRDLSPLLGFQVIVSLLPPTFHEKIATFCVANHMHFVCASYMQETIKKLHQEAIQNNLIVLMECGLDPGLDHMSAIAEFEQLHNEGAEIVSFESYCGGLVAPQSDNNPWHYKISWNPRNVVLAGAEGDAIYLKKGRLITVPYEQLFQSFATITLSGRGVFEGYPNRNSLYYKDLYQLHSAHTLIRGTLRKENFCAGWHQLVVMGYTQTGIKIRTDEISTYSQLTDFLIRNYVKTSPQLYISTLDARLLNQLGWLGIFDSVPIPRGCITAADALQVLLEDRWKLEPDDLDMVVMVHKIGYVLKKNFFYRTCELILEGNKTYTAMATTVGLPLGYAVEAILNGSYTERGVQIPLQSGLARTVLHNLEAENIVFSKRDYKVGDEPIG